MDWEQLKKFQCPHCWRELTQQDTVVQCTSCTFELSVAQYKKRILYGNNYQKPTNHQTWKWQNLHKSLCVIDGGFLMPSAGNPNVMRCIESGCPFRIPSKRIDEILADKNHSANRFLKKDGDGAE